MRKFVAVAVVSACFAVSGCGGGGAADPGPAIPPPGGEGGPVEPPPGQSTYLGGPDAVAVIGQADMVTGGSGIDAGSLNVPGAIAFSASNTYVADTHNHRILMYTGRPEPETPFNATLHFGQEFPDQVEDLGATRETFRRPGNVSIGGNVMAVADTGNNRVLVYTSLPTTPDAVPDFVLGQTGFATAAIGCGAGMHSPAFVHVGGNGTRITVADSDNGRVLTWTTAFITQNGEAPHFMFGQPTIDDCSITTSSIGKPSAVWSGSQTIVASPFDHRVMVFSLGANGSASPSVVLGQSAMANNLRAANDDDQNGQQDDRPSRRTLNFPLGVTSDGTRLAVVDALNHRVLVWNSIPSNSFQDADVVIGQGDDSHWAMNDADGDLAQDGHPWPNTLSNPGSAAFDGEWLYVVDRGNHRVLKFRVP